MAGLATALAFERQNVDVVVLERDDDPEDLSPESAFESWKRPGVPQFHHTHIFLARLRSILRDAHPRFFAGLAALGIEPSSLNQVLPPSQVDGYVPLPDDENSLHLWGRRATFEAALRRYVGRLENVRFVHSARVEGLVVEKTATRIIVRGVEMRRGGATETVLGDVVVDASGKRSKATEWLQANGAIIDTASTPSPIAYYCRHFQERDELPPKTRKGAGASLDYLVFGTFFAEQKTFSIAFACPESEPELSEFLRRPEGFDHVCGQIPLLAEWTSRSEPISRVLGGAGLVNRWHRYQTKGGPIVVGFFPVGDSHIQTNPVYGRGCSMAFVQAEALASVLSAETDAAARAQRFHADVRRLLKPHFDLSLTADKAVTLRARLARREPVSLSDRLVSYAYDEALAPALDRDPNVAREWIRGQQMREVSPPWVALLMVLRVVFHYVLLRLRPSLRRSIPKFGPSREDMLRSVARARDAAVARDAATAE
jgi:2-polyprenyl-6-methoxyphenol hydroxylase-like FAD-dependent oxidoreductase